MFAVSGRHFQQLDRRCLLRTLHISLYIDVSIGEHWPAPCTTKLKCRTVNTKTAATQHSTAPAQQHCQEGFKYLHNQASLSLDKVKTWSKWLSWSWILHIQPALGGDNVEEELEWAKLSAISSSDLGPHLCCSPASKGSLTLTHWIIHQDGSYWIFRVSLLTDIWLTDVIRSGKKRDEATVTNLLVAACCGVSSW